MSKYSLNAVFVQLKLINELIYCILWKLNPVFNFSLSQISQTPRCSDAIPLIFVVLICNFLFIILDLDVFRIGEQPDVHRQMKWE